VGLASLMQKAADPFQVGCHLIPLTVTGSFPPTVQGR